MDLNSATQLKTSQGGVLVVQRQSCISKIVVMPWKAISMQYGVLHL